MNGDHEEFTRRVGYRFYLSRGCMPETVRRNGMLKASLTMVNEGFAGIHNPRVVELVLKCCQSADEFVLDVDEGRGNRLFLPGPSEARTLDFEGIIPNDMPEGRYEMFLNLPDPCRALYGRPEYSIRLANTGTWDGNNGYNGLNHCVDIAGVDTVNIQGKQGLFRRRQS